ncbi:unnamed protein product [Ixodes hexagonus]
MQKELCKTRPNMVFVADAMARTFASRRLWVTTEHPTVAAVLSMYPAYQLGTVLQQEFTAATGKLNPGQRHSCPAKEQPPDPGGC